MSWVGVLETSDFTKVNQVPHQDFSSLENRLTLLEQESAWSNTAEGDAIAFHDSGFKSKIESKAWFELNAPKITLDFWLISIY